MERLGSIALAALAVVALATVAASVETVSTAPAVERGETTPGTPERYGGGGNGAGTPSGTQSATAVGGPSEETATPAGASSDGPPPWQVAAGLALFVCGGLAVLYGLTRGTADEALTDGDDPVPDPAVPDPDAVSLAVDAPPDNDVYRAWAALRDRAETPTDASTAADVRDAAVAAGLPEQPVSALTDLFCAVRYGDADATAERERRARSLASELSLSLRPTDGGGAS